MSDVLVLEESYVEDGVLIPYTLQVDTTQNLADWVLSHIDSEAVAYPDGKAPRTAIIRPQVFDPEVIEMTYQAEEGEEEEVTTVNVAESYFEDMQMAWNFAYAVYENMVEHSVPEYIARDVLPPKMLHTRLLVRACLPSTFDRLITWGLPVEYQELVTKMRLAVTEKE